MGVKDGRSIWLRNVLYERLKCEMVMFDVIEVAAVYTKGISDVLWV